MFESVSSQSNARTRTKKTGMKEKKKYSLNTLLLPLTRLIPLLLLNSKFRLRSLPILLRKQPRCHTIPQLPALIWKLPF